MEILKYVSQIALSAIVCSGIIFLLKGKIFDWFLAKKMAKDKLELDKELEDYKNNLKIITENAKIDYQKSLSNHNLYIQKRNLVYCEMYEKLKKVLGCLKECFGALVVEPQFDNINDFLKYIENGDFKYNEKTFFKEQIEKIMNEDVRKKTRFILKQHQFIKARNLFVDFHNYYVNNDIYLTENLSINLEDIRKLLNHWIILTDNYYFEDTSQYFKELNKLTDMEEYRTINSKINSIKQQLRIEIQGN